MGLIDSPIAGPKVIAYGKDGIRKVLLSNKKSVIEYTGNKDKGIIVIIKPGKKSKYKNLVDILDEMAISGVETYAIVNDFLPKETELLEKK
jgi:biopolymer transport protein ExbD